MYKHLGFPYRTFVHCRGFAPAAPRRAGVSVSVPLSGLPLSWPLLIQGLVSRYLTNYLISRRPILRHCFSEKKHSSTNLPSGFTVSFPTLSQTLGEVIDVLLSSPPVSCDPLTCMAKSNPNSSNLPQDQRELFLRSCFEVCVRFIDLKLNRIVQGFTQFVYYLHYWLFFIHDTGYHIYIWKEYDSPDSVTNT